jgi:SAM-dependent methyltransferase
VCHGIWPQETGGGGTQGALLFGFMKRQKAGQRAGKAYRYLLGDSRREAARLAAQARLWDPVSFALFDRLGVKRGWRVLEVGPGHGSLHLELRRRVGGPVDAVERSSTFARRLQGMGRRDGLGTGYLWTCDLADAKLPLARYDLVFARWVFLFLPDPVAHLRKLVRALKPGGLLALQDYHRENLAMVPSPADWPEFLAADRAFFASQGGDASIGGRLPDLYRKVGLTVVDTAATVKVGSPGSAVWDWLSAYFLGVIDRYGEHPPFTKRQAARVKRHWLAAAGEKTSLLIAPAVLDVVGRKA